jgi:large subunit ribosomal protein L10
MLAGAMKASLQQAVSLFAAPLSQMARLLAALEEDKGSEAGAEPEPADHAEPETAEAETAEAETPEPATPESDVAGDATPAS